MAVTKEYNAFPSFTKDGRNYLLNRSGRHPIDETGVFTSLENLNKYLSSDIVYPGQLVSVADDRTSGTNTDNRLEQGLYFINNTASKTDNYEAKKIAFLSDIDSGGGGSAEVDGLVNYQINPIVKLLNSLFSTNNTIWEEITEESSGYDPGTVTISLNDVIQKQKQVNSFIYNITNGDTIV